MSVVSETLRVLRAAKDWSQYDLAERSGVDRTTIDNAENDRHKTTAPKLLRLARALGYSTWEDAAFAAGAIKTPRTLGDPDGLIPVINQAPAGEVRDYHECSIDSGVGFTYIKRGDLEGDNLFAVVITGASMMPKLSEGDVVVFQSLQTDSAIEPGEIVYARLADGIGDGCTVARWRKLPDGRIRLEKDNPDFAPITCEPEDVIQLAAMIERRERTIRYKLRRVARGSDADISGERRVERDGDEPHGNE